MSITTDELRKIVETDHVQCGDAAAMARELLANREAQPAMWRYRYRRGPHKGEWTYVGRKSECPTRPFHEIQGLYTAPPAPAPAYPERLPCPVHLLPGLKFGKGVPTRSMLDALVRRAEYESEREAMTPEQKAEDDARIEAFKALLPRPPAPAVPEEAKLGEMPFLGKSERGYVRGWNDCRAAMLAQPVSGGYKLQDGWIACSEQTPVADGAYWCWFGKEKPSVIQQRVCIWNDRNHEWCDSAATHWMPLPAAPEGGNDA